MNQKQIIFIPGWATRQESLYSIVNHLRDSFQCSFLEWWDCLSENPEQNLLFKALRENNDPVILAGWSLGSLIAFSAAENLADKIEGIIIINGTSRFICTKNHPGIERGNIEALRFRLAQSSKSGLPLK